MSIPTLLLLGLVIIVTFIALKARAGARQLRRAEFIRTYRWPRGLLDRLEKHHPELLASSSKKPQAQ